MSKKTSTDYQAAVAMLEELLGDGQLVSETVLVAEMQQRGIAGPKVTLALDNANVRYLGNDDPVVLYYQLPQVRRPRSIPVHEWADALVRWVLSAGPVEIGALLDAAHACDVSWHALVLAKRRLGVIREEYTTPATPPMLMVHTTYRLPDTSTPA